MQSSFGNLSYPAMLFNSLEFLYFFSLTYLLYIKLGHRWQNRLLLAASYLFYGAWDWRFCSLIFVSTLVDYFCGLAIDTASSARRRKFFLFLSVAANLSILGFFKYFNFFVDSLGILASKFGVPFHPHVMEIILPVGISFYTFQTMSYTIDIYRKELKPTRHFLDFALFVAFFPQLIAGPIERARHLLPQILHSRRISWEGFSYGAFLVFWGLFEKIFVADNLAQIVDPIFGSHSSRTGLEMLIALYAFSFQILCDFDGYSNMARGLGRMLGFDIMVNFHLPYVSRSPREFWRRWHISLSSWLRDYLYIPLGGNRGGRGKTIRNLMVTMFLGGLWHGANWTFIIWGVFHGALLVIYGWFRQISSSANQFLSGNRLTAFAQGLVFFHLTVFGWLFFRSIHIYQAKDIMWSLLTDLSVTPLAAQYGVQLVFILIPFLLIQLAQWKTNDLDIIYKQHWAVKTVIYAFLTYLMLGWGVMSKEEFIYFQF